MERSKDPTGFLDQVRAVLKEADAATTPEQRRRALAAIKAVQLDCERRQENSLGAELAALVARANWSDDRVRHIKSRLAAARAALEGAT
jgi:hypothetical protein